MTWFGKTLAVLNIFGAAAFVYFALADYAKREAWAYANYVHDVARNGLPLDDKVTDDRESPIVHDLAEETKAAWFGSDKVSTQVDEVDRVKKLVDDKVGALDGDPQKQTVELARILLPFANHNSEREWLIGVRIHLATPADADKLANRLHDAFIDAVQTCQARPDDFKFPQTFLDAYHARGGAPALAFEQTLLNLLPAKPEKTFDEAVKKAQAAPAPAAPEQEAHDRALAFLRYLRDDDKATLRKLGDPLLRDKDGKPTNADTLDDVYQQTLTTLHDQLKAQLDGLFDVARNGPKSLADATQSLRDAQRRDIAHLLFNMVEVLQDGAVEKGVVADPAYNRVASVVGVTALVREINAQAAVLQRLAVELDGARTLERGEFATAYRALIDDLLSRAVDLQYATEKLGRDQQKESDQESLVKRREADVKEADDKLAAARAETEKQIAELRKKSDALHDRRIEGRDLLGDNLELERQIRDLEKKR